MTNTSIKSLIFDQKTLDYKEVIVDLKDVHKAIEKVKDNNTLEELTINEVYIDVDHDDLCFKIENCVQQINRTRNIKGVANLKVNIDCFCI